MNIVDKDTLFAEARRVLKPGGTFVVYDLMRSGDAPTPYPMPWAASAETSFVEAAHTYRDLLETSGFRIEREEDRAAFGLELFAEMRARAEAQGPSPLGMHVLVGPATQERLGNAIRAVQQGIITPVELIARAV